ncbi:cytochrome c1 [Stakelama saccharophila]|uniref:Cytochrome c1 n=1 Tax=Stakelama saccharophila TaxID=3075605 RepID=A0ABZ0B868_9SPHN|nr:cytochrome c1 [Stakelama sp. W311]WNO53215.1 cytochrome c1 [Stakelama sp. W311]
MVSLVLRYLNYLIGAAFTFVLLIALWGTVSELITNPPAESAAEEYHLEPKPLHLASDGPFGHWDKQQLQRGFQVYKEVCSACHSLRHVAFRDLEQLGYTGPEVKAIAEQWQIEQPDVNPDTGEADTRPNRPADHFPLPFPNEVAAKAANNNAVPPDLSLMVKAREGGAAYIHSLITGYRDQPKELLAQFPTAKTPPGLHYNPYFPTLNLAMPPPLTSAGQVQYADGTEATVDQMATDVAAFLTWTAEPDKIKRHQVGYAAVLFILIFCGLTFGAYKNIWRDKKH